MRLLEVITDFSIGGAQRLLSDLLPLFAQQPDFNVTLAVYSDPGESPLFAIIRNNPQIKVRILGVPLGHASAFNPFARLKAVKKLRHLMKEADICHVHLFPALYDAAIAAKGLPVKLIFTDHSTSNLRRRIPGLSAIERRIFSRYDRIVCISPAVRRSLINWLRTNPDDKRMTIIPNGINLSLFNPPEIKVTQLSEEPEEENPDFTDIDTSESYRALINDRRVTETYGRAGIPILMISRFTPGKDHPTLLRAFALMKNDEKYFRRLNKDVRSNLFLALAGTGKEIGKAKRLAEELGIAADTLFLGDRSDVPRLIRVAKAGVQISNWEGFGLTACEMLAGRLPLVASDIPGMADIIRDGARLVAPSAPDELADALAEIIAPSTPEQIELTRLLQAEGLKIARRYDIHITLHRYLSTFKGES